MAQVSAGSTDPELLKRVAALWDNPAWVVFFELYDPSVRRWSSAYGFDAASVDELCQRVWVELARRMPTYQYDPGGSFRAWLKRLCHHRAVDMYREGRDHPSISLGDDELIAENMASTARCSCDFDCCDDDQADSYRLLLLREAREVQEEVRRKVKPVRWEVFWRVVIEGESISETASAMGLKYATVYAAARHVAGALREEGRRRQACVGPGVPSSAEGE